MNPIAALMGLLDIQKRPSPVFSPKTIDLTRRTWGNDFVIHKVIKGGKTLSISGWHTPLPEVGDFFILPNKGETTRYRAKHVELCFDPPDMFHATLVFAPRPAQEDKADDA